VGRHSPRSDGRLSGGPIETEGRFHSERMAHPSAPDGINPRDPAKLARLILQRGLARLVPHIEELDERIGRGDTSTWPEYRDALRTLAIVLDQAAPGRGGELLTTSQMAVRLGLSPKSLLRHKAAGSVRPAVQRGKLIRWRGDEVPR
jgi:hypothetical protein